MVRPSSVRNRNADRARVSATATTNATSRFTSTNTGPSQSVAVASDDVTRVGSGPNTISATFSSTSATPSIRRICISWGASTIRSTSPRWIRRPSTNSAAAQRANPAYGSTPACVASRYARYMPQTIMSPWAKFTTRITPKISVSPTAIRLYTPPNSTPLINPCPTSVRSTKPSPKQANACAPHLPTDPRRPQSANARTQATSGSDLHKGGRMVVWATAQWRTSNRRQARPGAASGRGWEGATGPVPVKRAAGAARPDGAQPTRGSARVPRGPVAPSHPRAPAAPAALRLGPRKDELLHRSLARPDSDGFLREDLDHRRDGVGIVAELVKGNRTAVVHEAAGVVGLLHRVDDRVGIVEARCALEDVGDHEHAVVGVARVRVERLAARALPALLRHRAGFWIFEVGPRHARHHVLEVPLQLSQLARLVEGGAAGSGDAQHLIELLRDCRQQTEGGGCAVV